MRASVSRAVMGGLFVMAGLAASVPPAVDAACGGNPFRPGFFARDAARHAHTVFMARLIEEDENLDLHFEVIEVYRGQAPASPIVFEWPGGADMGGCIGLETRPGWRFIYADGEPDEIGRSRRVIFPHVPGRGWISNYTSPPQTLDRLLGWLGVLPDTSTATSVPPIGRGPDSFHVVLIASLAAFVGVLLRPARPHGIRPVQRRRVSSR